MLRAMRVLVATTTVLGGALAAPPLLSAQTPPDTPSIKIGTTIFADYTVQQSPKIEDSDGNDVTLSSFNITRAYINLIGKLTSRVSFRLTPDITRETGVGSSLNGSYTLRLKFAYAELGTEGWLPAGSWARLGMQPTPWLDWFQETYRYRFQGTPMAEREGYLTFSDAGASARVALPNDYGDIHVGLFNGEGAYQQEINDQKGFEIRGAVRPLPKSTVLKGLRIAGFVDRDAYLKGHDRKRNIVGATFDHKFVNAGFDYLSAADRRITDTVTRDARAWTAFVNPRSTIGWEGLFRYDHLRDDISKAGRSKQRVIAGVAYWLKPVDGVTSALLFDVDNATFTNYSPAQVTQRRIGVHLLINY
jgi:hypothetical protein